MRKKELRSSSKRKVEIDVFNIQRYLECSFQPLKEFFAMHCIKELKKKQTGRIEKNTKSNKKEKLIINHT